MATYPLRTMKLKSHIMRKPLILHSHCERGTEIISSIFIAVFFAQSEVTYMPKTIVFSYSSSSISPFEAQAHANHINIPPVCKGGTIA